MQKILSALCLIGCLTVIISFRVINYSSIEVPVVFVSRLNSPEGAVSLELGTNKGVPGNSSMTRFNVPGDGRLMILNTDGTTTTLVDGSIPSSTPFNIVDVNAPDVSYDGQTIVFAGATQPGTYGDNLSLDRYNLSPGVWRLYTINIDGSNLKKITYNDAEYDALDFDQLYPKYISAAAGHRYTRYDDTDPAWLPDGRIVFASTRWPGSRAYGGARNTNLYVITPNGTDNNDLHRITAEMAGAERPVVDPLTGEIIYARWWKFNGNFPIDDVTEGEFSNTGGSYLNAGGIMLSTRKTMFTYYEGNYLAEFLNRTTWHLASIHPDGTNLKIWSINYNSEHDYAGMPGGFTPSGKLATYYSPHANTTEQSGYGGVRLYERGASFPQHIIGVSERSGGELVYPNGTEGKPTPSFNIYKSDFYAGDPYPYSENDWLVSLGLGFNQIGAEALKQDYGLYLINANNPSSPTLLYDEPARLELRAKPVMPRNAPPIIADSHNNIPSKIPPNKNLDPNLKKDGVFTFECLNIYGNAPVDVPISSGVPIGTVNTLRFYASVQPEEINPVPYDKLENNIAQLLDEKIVSGDGYVIDTQAPANIQLFEQAREHSSLGYDIPRTGAAVLPDGIAHVASANFGRPGSKVTCVGCHVGHSLIEVPSTREEAAWTNVAPGAKKIEVSNEVVDPKVLSYLIDRKVQLSNGGNAFWFHKASDDIKHDGNNAWFQLEFYANIEIKNLILHGIPEIEPNGNRTSDINIGKTLITLFDAEGNEVYATSLETSPAESGTPIPIPNVIARKIKVEMKEVSGNPYDSDNNLSAGLAEIEVIAKGTDDIPLSGNLINIDKNQVYVYPNPVDEFLRISSNSKIEKITITDLNGKQIGKWNGDLNHINLSYLTTGIYLMQTVNKAGEVNNFKIIKK